MTSAQSSKHSFYTQTPHLSMKASGPQSDRDRVWIGKHAELSREREDLSIDKGAEKQVFDGELVRLRRENVALKDHLQRSLKELKFYQHRYPSAYSPGNRGEDEELPPWKTSPELMTPLLEAYDTRIAELESVVNRQNEDMVRFQEKMELVLGENEKLRTSQLEHLHNSGRDPTSLSSPLNEELLSEMNERVEILMAENALLVEQKAVLSAELERVHGDYERCEDEMSDLSQKYGSARREISDLMSRLPQAEGDRERAAGEVARASEALGRAEAENDELREQLQLCKESHKSVEEKLQDARRALKVLSDNAEEEGFSCVRRTKAAEERVKELHGILHSKIQELEAVQEAHRKMKRDYQSTRQDAEGMLQVMSAQERQINDYASREADVEKLAKDCKEKIEEAMIARDQAISKENQLQRNYERLLEEKRIDAQAKQAAVDEAVLQTRQRAELKIKGLEDQLSEVAGRLAHIKADESRTQREFMSIKEALERTRAQQDEERRVFESSLKAIEEKLKIAELGNNEEAIRRREVQEQNKTLRSSIDSLRSQVEASRVQLTDRDFSRDREISTLKNSLKEVSSNFADMSKALNRRVKELEELRSEYAEQMILLEKKREEDVLVHRRRADEAETKMREFENGANGESRRSKYIIDQIKDKFSITIQQLETKLEEEKAVSKRLLLSSRELAEAYRILTDEKSSLEKVVSSLKSKNTILRDDVLEAQRTVAELTEQLASSFEAREQAVKNSVRELAKVNTVAKLKSKAADFLGRSQGGSYFFTNENDNSHQNDRKSRDEDEQSEISDIDVEATAQKNFDDVLMEAHKTFCSPSGKISP